MPPNRIYSTAIVSKFKKKKKEPKLLVPIDDLKKLTTTMRQKQRKKLHRKRVKKGVVRLIDQYSN